MLGAKVALIKDNAGIERVVNAAIVDGEKLPPAEIKTGKLNEVKFGHVAIVNVLLIAVKLEKVKVVDKLLEKTRFSTATPFGIVNPVGTCAPNVGVTIAPNGGGAAPVYAIETA